MKLVFEQKKTWQWILSVLLESINKVFQPLEGNKRSKSDKQEFIMALWLLFSNKELLGFPFMNLYCLQKIPPVHGYPLWILEVKVDNVFPPIVTHLWKILTAALHSQYTDFAEWEFSTNCCPSMFPIFLSAGYWSSVCLGLTPFSF